VTRAPRLMAAAAAAVLLVTGCGTVRAGAAATVGEERITVSQLRDLVTRGLDDPSAEQTVGADRPAYERSVLARMIQHLVLVEAAREQGVSVTNGQVDAAYDRFAAQLGGEAQLKAEALKAGIAETDLRGVIADTALRDAIADALTADIEVPEDALRQAYQQSIAQYDQVQSAHILVPTLKQAQDLLARVRANPASFPELARQYSQDTTTKERGGELGYQGRGALEKPFETAIFGAEPGTFVLARTTFGFHVISVTDRRTTTFEQAVPELRRQLLGPDRQQALVELLSSTVRRLGVHVNPRYGTFDPTQEDVVPHVVCAATDASSPSPRPDDAAPEEGAPEATPSPGC
jgi:parvulin-like peptidyl-prolyl isomerase